MYME